jgi:thiamine-phosphate pyrophosphorylase
MMPQIPVPCLSLVTDRGLCASDPEELVKRVAQAVRGGVNLVQLREKDLPGGQLLRLAEDLRNVTSGRALLFINERVDVAIACGADGVQLGEEGLPVEAARLVGDRTGQDGLLIGRSVHSVEGAMDAQGWGADLLVVGTIFPTGSHPGAAPAGPQLIADIVGKVNIPFVGIGGIGPSNAHQVMDAGAAGVAVISAILAAGDPEQAARELKGSIDVAWGEERTGRVATGTHPYLNTGRTGG